MANHGFPQKQTGSALFVGLIILLVLTILGVTIIQVVTQQERMARNLRNQNIAFQAAETALRAGESEISGNAAPFSPFDFTLFGQCTAIHRCLPSTSATPRWDSVNWAPASPNTAALPVGLALPAGVAQPRYLIELLSGKPTFDPSLGCTAAVFRVTARGFGPDRAVANLQTIYRFKPVAC